MFFFCPPAVAFWVYIEGLSHFGYWDNRIWILKFKYNRFRSKRFYTALSKNSNFTFLKDMFLVRIFELVNYFQRFQKNELIPTQEGSFLINKRASFCFTDIWNGPVKFWILTTFNLILSICLKWQNVELNIDWSKCQNL